MKFYNLSKAMQEEVIRLLNSDHFPEAKILYQKYLRTINTGNVLAGRENLH